MNIEEMFNKYIIFGDVRWINKHFVKITAKYDEYIGFQIGDKYIFYSEFAEECAVHVIKGKRTEIIKEMKTREEVKCYVSILLTMHGIYKGEEL